MSKSSSASYRFPSRDQNWWLKGFRLKQKLDFELCSVTDLTSYSILYIMIFFFSFYRVAGWNRDLGPEPNIQSLSPSTKKRDYIRSQSETRRNRILSKPVAKKKPQKLKPLKREFGKGLVGKLLNRTFNRNRIDSKVREQMEDISDHRFVLI